MGGFTIVYIYALRDPDSRAFRHVGQTVDPERRFSPDDPLRAGLGEDLDLVVLEEVMPARSGRLNYLSDPTVKRRVAYWKRTLTALGETLLDEGPADFDVTLEPEEINRLRALRPVRPRL